MKKIKDKKIILLIVILLVFTICYFIIANKISYAFGENYNFSDVNKNKEEIIISCAQKYGYENKDSFNEEGLLYITVQNLIDNGCLATNEEGKIRNFNNTNEILNNKKIRIKEIDGKINAEIYS